MPSGVIVSDLIRSAMRLTGAIASGETPTADELTDGLLVLNDMLEDWSTERLSVWGSANETFSTVAGQAKYTIGTAGNFVAQRPLAIDAAYVTLAGVDFPLRTITQLAYNDIPQKTQQQPLPELLLYVNVFPLGEITLWPVPSQIIPITISAGQLLTSPVTLASALTGPPGFAKAIRYSLAVEYGIEFSAPLSGVLAEVAADAKADYKRANLVPVEARFDLALTASPYESYIRGY
jgi:hypothetical protein